MPRLIFVNRFFYPDHSATSQILSDLAFDLASTGRDVHIVTSAQIYDDAKAALPVSEIINGVCIGRSEGMEAYVAAALRLSPRDTTAYVWMAGPESPSCTAGYKQPFRKKRRIRHTIRYTENYFGHRDLRPVTKGRRT